MNWKKFFPLVLSGAIGITSVFSPAYAQNNLDDIIKQEIERKRGLNDFKIKPKPEDAIKELLKHDENMLKYLGIIISEDNVALETGSDNLRNNIITNLREYLLRNSEAQHEELLTGLRDEFLASKNDKTFQGFNEFISRKIPSDYQDILGALSVGDSKSLAEIVSVDEIQSAYNKYNSAMCGVVNNYQKTRLIDAHIRGLRILIEHHKENRNLLMGGGIGALITGVGVGLFCPPAGAGIFIGGGGLLNQSSSSGDSIESIKKTISELESKSSSIGHELLAEKDYFSNPDLVFRRQYQGMSLEAVLIENKVSRDGSKILEVYEYRFKQDNEVKGIIKLPYLFDTPPYLKRIIEADPAILARFGISLRNFSQESNLQDLLKVINTINQVSVLATEYSSQISSMAVKHLAEQDEAKLDDRNLLDVLAFKISRAVKEANYYSRDDSRIWQCEVSIIDKELESIIKPVMVDMPAIYYEPPKLEFNIYVGAEFGADSSMKEITFQGASIDLDIDGLRVGVRYNGKNIVPTISGMPIELQAPALARTQDGLDKIFQAEEPASSDVAETEEDNNAPYREFVSDLVNKDEVIRRLFCEKLEEYVKNNPRYAQNPYAAAALLESAKKEVEQRIISGRNLWNSRLSIMNPESQYREITRTLDVVNERIKVSSGENKKVQALEGIIKNISSLEEARYPELKSLNRVIKAVDYASNIAQLMNSSEAEGFYDSLIDKKFGLEQDLFGNASASPNLRIDNFLNKIKNIDDYIRQKADELARKSYENNDLEMYSELKAARIVVSNIGAELQNDYKNALAEALSMENLEERNVQLTKIYSGIKNYERENTSVLQKPEVKLIIRGAKDMTAIFYPPSRPFLWTYSFVKNAIILLDPSTIDDFNQTIPIKVHEVEQIKLKAMDEEFQRKYNLKLKED